MPTLDELHQGIGSGEVTTDFNREVLAEAQPYRHVVIYRDGKLKGSFVLLSRSPSEEGITLAGLGLGFWQGLPNKDGPVIRRREYIAGNNHLSNGGFELLDAVDFPLFWSRSEGSSWAPYTADKYAGTRSMRVSGDLGKDDVLDSTDTGDHSIVRSGALVRAQVRGSIIDEGIRRYRLRTTFDGRFDPPDLLAEFDYDDDWTNVSEFAGDLSDIDADSFVMGPCTQPDYIENGGFETGDFTDWVTVEAVGTTNHIVLADDDPPGGSHSGGYLGAIQGTAMGSNAGTIEQATGPGVEPGEAYRLVGFAKEYPSTEGEAKLSLLCIRQSGAFEYAYTPGIRGSDYHFAGSESEYKRLALDYEVRSDDDPVIGILAKCEAQFTDFGEFDFDDVSLIRTKGNVCKLQSPEIDVIPERTYKLLVPLTGSWSGAAANGTVHAYVALKGTGRTDQAGVSTAIDVSQSATETVISHDVTPPSGYDRVQVTLVGTDLVGGSVTVGRATLVDQDTSTHVVDEVIGPTGDIAWTLFTQDSTAPDGTEKVRVQLVAEAGAGVAAFDEVDWHRREATTTKAQIVDELLRDPDTGLYLVGPGSINVSGLPTWDWYLDLVNNGEAMREFLAGRCDPPLEWRHDPDNTFSVGTKEQIFADSGLVFADEGLLLLSRLEVQANVQDQLSRVLAIGAAIQRRAPLPDAVILGEAETTISDAYDWFGNPVRRTRVIEDSALNFQAFADARAASELGASSLGTENVHAEISAWQAWGDFVCGDTVHAHKDAAGLLEDLSNPKTYKGRRIYPKPLRVLGRRLDMASGDGWEVGIRRPDATVYWIDPDLIRWADRTRATLELGERRVDYANDPQGPAAGLQFLKHRALQGAR